MKNTPFQRGVFLTVTKKGSIKCYKKSITQDIGKNQEKSKKTKRLTLFLGKNKVG